MPRKRKNKLSGPRRKGMRRSGRLQSAVPWLKKFKGENVLRAYCHHYGVDWRCAAIELQQLGVHLDPQYLERREMAERNLIRLRMKRRKAQQEPSESWSYDSPMDAYLAEDYAALYDMECREEKAVIA